MNVEFEVEVDGKPRHVVIRFGTERDVRALGRWHFQKKPGQGEAILDALEYARLASKRWRYYQRAGETVGSVQDLQARILRNPRVGLGMILVVCPTWPS